MNLKIIENFDKYLFLKINTQWTNGFLDAVIPWWRDQNTWIPLYFFLLFFVLVNFGNRTWLWLLFAIVTISVSDPINSGVVKYFFNRPRPCNDAVMRLVEILRIPIRPGSPSFPSSHACNHFAIALYFFMTLKKYIGRWAWLFIVWAATISYGQVYVGVHYPLDVLAGAMEGTLLGLGVYYAYYKTNTALSNRLKDAKRGAFIGI